MLPRKNPTCSPSVVIGSPKPNISDEQRRIGNRDIVAMDITKTSFKLVEPTVIYLSNFRWLKYGAAISFGSGAVANAVGINSGFSIQR
jgi:hypothetical protein